MTIYSWSDEDGNTYYYTSHKEAVRHLRALLKDEETATPVSSIESRDVIELLKELTLLSEQKD